MSILLDDPNEKNKPLSVEVLKRKKASRVHLLSMFVVLCFYISWWYIQFFFSDGINWFKNGFLSRSNFINTCLIKNAYLLWLPYLLWSINAYCFEDLKEYRLTVWFSKLFSGKEPLVVKRVFFRFLCLLLLSNGAFIGITWILKTMYSDSFSLEALSDVTFLFMSVIYLVLTPYLVRKLEN